MASELDLRGVWVPLITPFDPAGAVDLDAIERLCHEYLDAGVAGIVALGTTGEPSALDADEKRSVLETITRTCAARDARVIVGTGTNDTRTTIAATLAAAELPAVVGVLVVVPYYVRPSEAGIVAHFKAVADASPVPLVLYNIPVRTGRVVGPAAMLDLARTPNIAGVKQAVGALDTDTLEILAGAPEGFAVLGGDDAFHFPIVCMGGHGAICASAHLCTERWVAMIECGLAGKTEDGRVHAEALLPVVNAGFAEPNPAVFKGALHAQGRIASADVRLPLTNATAASVDRLVAAAQRASR